jgi:hypothetical protein
MTLRTWSLALALALAAAPVVAPSAQPRLPSGPGVRERGSWTPVRVAKWALLGAAIGLGVYARSNSRNGDDAYADLRALCRTQPERCSLAGGAYADPEVEGLYARAVSSDRRAQVGIIGGQVALLGSAALFVYDLRNGRGPADIPYPSSAHRARLGMLAGLRLTF